MFIYLLFLLRADRNTRRRDRPSFGVSKVTRDPLVPPRGTRAPLRRPALPFRPRKRFTAGRNPWRSYSQTNVGHQVQLDQYACTVEVLPSTGTQLIVVYTIVPQRLTECLCQLKVKSELCVQLFRGVCIAPHSLVGA